MVKVFNVTNRDTTGEAFNNFGLADKFIKHGVIHSFIVDRKESCNSTVRQMNTSNLINQINTKLNFYTGYQNRLNIWSGIKFNTLDKSSSDLFHFHLVENGWFHIPTAFKWMGKIPSIWTFHDLWPITGHCIQPLGCLNWEKGCRKCPDLDRAFKVKIDRAKQQFKYKIKKLESLNLNIHVSTEWTRKQIIKISSDLGQRTTVIPFGISLPRQESTDKSLREELGLTVSDRVILVRGTPGNYKNIESLRLVFENISQITKKIVLIDIDSAGFFKNIEFKKLIQMDWIPRSRLIELIRISDAVLVPSSAETFGVLITEAQLCGKPVLVQSNTACAEVAGGKENSFEFNGFNMQSTINSFLHAILDNNQKIFEIAERGRLRAELKFAPNLYVERMSNLYHRILEDHKNSNG